MCVCAFVPTYIVYWLYPPLHAVPASPVSPVSISSATSVHLNLPHTGQRTSSAGQQLLILSPVHA